MDEYFAGLTGAAAIKAAALLKLLEALGHEASSPLPRVGDRTGDHIRSNYTARTIP